MNGSKTKTEVPARPDDIRETETEFRETKLAITDVLRQDHDSGERFSDPATDPLSGEEFVLDLLDRVRWIRSAIPPE